MGYLLEISGRITRLQYWLAMLLSAAIMYGGMFAIGINLSEDATEEELASALIPLLVLFVPCIWISVSAIVQRYHDRGKSGFWYFIGFIPIVGPIWQIVECGCLAGEPGSNAYGDNPKGNNMGNSSVHQEIQAVRAAASGAAEAPSKTKLALNDAMASAVKQHRNAAAPSATAMRTSAAASGPVFGKRV